MNKGTAIIGIKARQAFSLRGHPGVEATVTTANGATGISMVAAGTSVGSHEVTFAYDEGEGWAGKDWKGKGVGRAVAIIEQAIAPKLIGMDAANQREIDDALLSLDDTPGKTKLGGNATASVSAAALRAGSNALELPLYQHIGGVNARTLPVPGVLMFLGGRRYQPSKKSGTKPTYSLMCYGFDSFAEASHAAYWLYDDWRKVLVEKYGVESTAMPRQHAVVSSGVIKHDHELLDELVNLIAKHNCEGKVGIQVDVAASCYYHDDIERFVGLFTDDKKSRDDMFRYYEELVNNYPFVIIEDPLDEDDWEGHAILAKETGIEIVGDDLFATNPERVQTGISAGACNAVLLKVNQIGTISEAFDMVEMAYDAGYGVMPCESRGEGPAIADYCVGLNTGHLREGAIGFRGNRFLEIEAELGDRAKFAGRSGIKLSRTDR
jgi:enolase